MQSFNMIRKPEDVEVVLGGVCPYTLYNAGAIVYCMCHYRHLRVIPFDYLAIEPYIVELFELHSFNESLISYKKFQTCVRYVKVIFYESPHGSGSSDGSRSLRHAGKELF